MSTEQTNETAQEQVLRLAKAAKVAAAAMRTVSSDVKNAALLGMAEALVARQHELFVANAKDIAAGRERGMSAALLDRLTLNEKRVAAMADGCREIAALPDPVGVVISGGKRPNGLRIEQVRTPLGVVGIVYESRPNVTVDAAALCLKAGNACILRGGSDAIHSNTLLTSIITDAATAAGVPAGAIQLIETTDRAATSHLVTLNDYIDLVIPRGGEGLKKSLSAVATVPLIFAAGGICHVFVDESADIETAADIVFNAKVQRPSACNALETLLVHKNIATQFLPVAAKKLCEAGVELRGDDRARESAKMAEVADSDWDEEYLALVLAVRVVDDIDAAIAHIGEHGSGHSDSILSADYANIEKFIAQVDAAAVYANASTRFTDGFEFGLGAEVGISTQKLHARGPMGLEALTSTKYVVRGDGHLRG